MSMVFAPWFFIILLPTLAHRSEKSIEELGAVEKEETSLARGGLQIDTTSNASLGGFGGDETLQSMKIHMTHNTIPECFETKVLALGEAEAATDDQFQLYKTLLKMWQLDMLWHELDHKYRDQLFAALSQNPDMSDPIKQASMPPIVKLITEQRQPVKSLDPKKLRRNHQQVFCQAAEEAGESPIFRQKKGIMATDEVQKLLGESLAKRRYRAYAARGKTSLHAALNAKARPYEPKSLGWPMYDTWQYREYPGCKSGDAAAWKKLEKKMGEINQLSKQEMADMAEASFKDMADQAKLKLLNQLKALDFYEKMKRECLTDGESRIEEFLQERKQNQGSCSSRSSDHVGDKFHAVVPQVLQARRAVNNLMGWDTEHLHDQCYSDPSCPMGQLCSSNVWRTHFDSIKGWVGFDDPAAGTAFWLTTIFGGVHAAGDVVCHGFIAHATLPWIQGAAVADPSGTALALAGVATGLQVSGCGIWPIMAIATFFAIDKAGCSCVAMGCRYDESSAEPRCVADDEGLGAPLLPAEGTKCVLIKEKKKCIRAACSPQDMMEQYQGPLDVASDPDWRKYAGNLFGKLGFEKGHNFNCLGVRSKKMMQHAVATQAVDGQDDVSMQAEEDAGLFPPWQMGIQEEALKRIYDASLQSHLEPPPDH